jgi:hypothetical protein
MIPHYYFLRFLVAGEFWLWFFFASGILLWIYAVGMFTINILDWINETGTKYGAKKPDQ